MSIYVFWRYIQFICALVVGMMLMAERWVAVVVFAVGLVLAMRCEAVERASQ